MMTMNEKEMVIMIRNNDVEAFSFRLNVIPKKILNAFASSMHFRMG